MRKAVLFLFVLTIAGSSMGQFNNETDQTARKPMFSIQEGATKAKQDELQKSNNFNAYPIPTENFINLENIMLGSVVDIMDLGGELLLTFDITRTNQRIDISELSAGIYFLRLSFAGTTLRTIRVIKE